MFVFPSRTEGLPNALLEAMAAGKPIVTTDVPGCRDLITHEQTGLLVPYGDARALAGAIVRIFSDPSLSARFGQESRRAAAKNWRIETTWRAYESIYCQIQEHFAQKLPTLPHRGR
jgi:glycosyltransferase involved in cell wall biosynthesis